VLLLRTVIEKLYACAVGVAGNDTAIGELAKVAFVTALNPDIAGDGAAMLY
jgi:hypothetical protein